MKKGGKHRHCITSFSAPRRNFKKWFLPEVAQIVKEVKSYRKFDTFIATFGCSYLNVKKSPKNKKLFIDFNGFLIFKNNICFCQKMDNLISFPKVSEVFPYDVPYGPGDPFVGSMKTLIFNFKLTF